MHNHRNPNTTDSPILDCLLDPGRVTGSHISLACSHLRDLTTTLLALCLKKKDMIGLPLAPQLHVEVAEGKSLILAVAVTSQVSAVTMLSARLMSYLH